MHNMASLGVLEGRDGHKVLTCCLDLLRQGTYRMCGAFFRWSVVQGGPGLPIFSPAFYALWINDHTNCIISEEAEFITDLKLQQLANKVYLCTLLSYC